MLQNPSIHVLFVLQSQVYSLGATLYVCTRVSNPRELSDETRELLNWMVEGSHSRRIELDAVEREAAARLRALRPDASNGNPFGSLGH